MTGPWLEIWKECCFALNWFGPSKQTEIDVMFVQRTQEYGNWFTNNAIMRHGVFIDKCGYNIWTARNHGRARQGERAYRQVCGQRGRNVTVALAVSPVNGLVLHSAYVGGMNARRFNDFLVQTRQNLDPDEEVIFIYDGAPAHRNLAIPATNTELEMPPAYSPFLNTVEHGISSLKAAMKGDVSRPEIQARMVSRWEGCEPDCYSRLFSAA